jgi:hypothetical protein
LTNVPSTCTPQFTTTYTYYYFSPANSLYNISDQFYTLQDYPYYNTMNTLGFTNLTTKVPAENGHYKIAQFITNAFEPNIATFTKGIYQVHLHSADNFSSSLSDVALYTQVWVVGNNDDNLFMLGQSGLSQTLQDNDTEYISNFYLNQTTLLNPTDRLAIFVFANIISGFGNPANVSLYMGGVDNSHISVPTTTQNPCQFTAETSNTVLANKYNTSGTPINLSPFGEAFAGICFGLFMIFVYRLIVPVEIKTDR